jgi:sortase A
MKIRVSNGSRALRWLEAFLLGVSLGALCIWSASIVIPAAWDRWANWEFDREVRESHAGPTAAVNSRSPIPTDKVVGRLTIPRLHLSAMVREGDGERTLSLALGHIPGTALPGQHGNVGVAGHRDALFRGLKDVRQNDIIRFQTVDGDYVYQVADTRIVKPDEISVLQGSSHSELTLVTCYPFYYVGSAPDRFIVKARAISAPN